MKLDILSIVLLIACILISISILVKGIWYIKSKDCKYEGTLYIALAISTFISLAIITPLLLEYENSPQIRENFVFPVILFLPF